VRSASFGVALQLRLEPLGPSARLLSRPAVCTPPGLPCIRGELLLHGYRRRRQMAASNASAGHVAGLRQPSSVPPPQLGTPPSSSDAGGARLGRGFVPLSAVAASMRTADVIAPVLETRAGSRAGCSAVIRTVLLGGRWPGVKIVDLCYVVVAISLLLTGWGWVHAEADDARRAPRQRASFASGGTRPTGHTGRLPIASAPPSSACCRDILTPGAVFTIVPPPFALSVAAAIIAV
jgi:hypothetical protein